ncbi:hypothetical protein G7Y79_00026g058800 [Physcia stellaris]|nr:hypothetical protein G7Y79_00026g058800 [Physcia stellaris]
MDSHCPSEGPQEVAFKGQVDPINFPRSASEIALEKAGQMGSRLHPIACRPPSMPTARHTSGHQNGA